MSSPRASEQEASREPRTDRRLLVRYRVLAFTTATLLIVLVFVGVPLQLAAHDNSVVNVVGTAHGFLYLVYLYVALDLSRALRVPLLATVAVLLAGTVPFCAFVAERVLTRRFEAAVAAATASGQGRERGAP
ncbi:MAG: DUF3817 domain-containing protein [Actinomycetota bacterium]|nr:DUF3817 domain-containing protein [Actinomycetota bacterium]